MVLSPMKKILPLMILLSTSIYSQIYKVNDFNLNGNLKKVSVVCYDIVLEEGEFLEGFPYSSQTLFHTDLNLHYLEFDSEGTLTRSRLYYPRDFYGQFQWMIPQFNLEESDFGSKKNYLGMDYRYKYSKTEEGTLIRVYNSTNSFFILVDDQNRLIEDEYYNYLYKSQDGKDSTLKRRKGSQYDFRRIDTTLNGDREISKEYINNSFPQSQRVKISRDNIRGEMFISLGRIKGFSETINNGLVIERESVDLSWRNRINPWPEIEFNEEISFNEFLDSIPRPFKSYKSIYTYKENLLIKEDVYEVSGKREKLIATYNFDYENSNLKEVVFISDPNGDSLTRYKSFAYDENSNWIEKLVGKIEYNDNDESVRVPQKRYIRTLTYYN